jgi:NADH-quinone oxidoreductase subunit M
VLGVLAVCVLGLGVYPMPLLEVMHSTVENLLQHAAISKLD